MRLIIQPDSEQLAQWAANYIASKIIKANPTPEKPFKLGLAYRIITIGNI